MNTIILLLDSPKEKRLGFCKKTTFQKTLVESMSVVYGHNCNGWELKIVQFQTKVNVIFIYSLLSSGNSVKTKQLIIQK